MSATLVRQWSYRALLLVVVLAAAAILLLARSDEPSLATSGGSAYQVPEVTDTNPDPKIVVTTITADETTVDIGTGVPVHAQTFNGGIPGPTFQLNVGDRVIVHFHNSM